MDHLHRAAGEAERHPPQRARARPLEQVLGRRDQETLVRQLAVQPVEELLIGRDHLALGIVEEADRAGVRLYSQSNAPFFHA